jgi:hypothetical protein
VSASWSRRKLREAITGGIVRFAAPAR